MPETEAKKTDIVVRPTACAACGGELAFDGGAPLRPFGVPGASRILPADLLVACRNCRLVYRLEWQAVEVQEEAEPAAPAPEVAPPPPGA